MKITKIPIRQQSAFRQIKVISDALTMDQCGIDPRRNASVKLGTEKFFLNNEMHETTRKNFMVAALTARILRYFYEFFPVILCLLL